MTAKPGPRSGHADPREELSCLLDGELEGEAARDCVLRLCRDAEAQADWALWSAVGDALRSSDVAALHSPGFSARVARALQDEPAILAPRPPRVGRRVVRRLVLPGAAAAAAGVMLVLVALPVLRQPAAPVQVASDPARPALAQKKATERSPAPVAERSPELEAYLQAHREMAGSIGLTGASRYLRHASAVTVER